MKANGIVNHFKMFLERHPTFVGSEEDIYMVRENISIKLLLEGGFIIELAGENCEINFNSIQAGVLVLAFRKEDRITRLGVDRIIAFELLRGKKSQEDVNSLFLLPKHKKN